jgi:DGQHR domain-containing protein
MKNFIKISALEVLQLHSKSGAVYTSRVTFSELLGIQRLTERTESSFDPFGEKISKFNQFEDDEFQRHLNNSKLNQLHKYLNDGFEKKNEGIIYPSSVILSLDINEDNSDQLSEEAIESKYYDEIQSCFTIEKGGITSIYVPNTKRICLIVDGQHRFYGLKKYYDETNDEDKRNKILNFQFIATILLGYDPYQVAEVFANVNFNQKPVNKSLYYDIFGSAAKEKNEIQLAHFLALHMQNNEESPLNGMIKLLGKGYGLFSQAFFVEKLLIHFKNEGVWTDLYKNYLMEGDRFLNIPNFLILYFEEIKNAYSECWPVKEIRGNQEIYSAHNYKFILCKTTGMGAFFRLVRDIYPLIKGLNSETEKREKLSNLFTQIKVNEAIELFSKEGQFGRGGSEGFQVRLYRELKGRYKIE